MGKQAPDYFSKWYEENKDERNEKRRKRYEEDPEYRSRVVKRSREQRDRRRRVPKVKLPRFQTPKEVELADGSTIYLYSVGAFAKLIQRSIQSLTHWEKRGLVPETPYRDSRGFRYYTKGMMAAVIREIDGRKRLFPVDPKMFDRIEAAWRALGVPVGEADEWDDAIAKTKTIEPPTDDDVFDEGDDDEGDAESA